MSKNDVDFLRVACTFAARSKRGVRTEMQQCRGWISMEVMPKNDVEILGGRLELGKPALRSLLFVRVIERREYMQKGIFLLSLALLICLNVNVLIGSNLSLKEIINLEPTSTVHLTDHPTYWQQQWYVYCGIGRGGCFECRCVEGGWWYMCQPGESWYCCRNGECTVF
jgi:hypothetical protein